MNRASLHKDTNYAVLPVIGVVFGDIGTSPLYAIKSCFSISAIEVNEFNIIGLVSLFIWCLFYIVSLKYVYLALKMDHQGEGGILSLSTLVASCTKHQALPIILGILGVSFFFGDGIVTPAISVLSAVEGIAIIRSNLSSYVLPITLIIITFLFFIQKFGTAKIGYFFGPIMSIWFLALLLLGIYNIYEMPIILKAFNPYYAISFLVSHEWITLTILGGVILVVTGAEALYADLGHFGRKPIALAWNLIVFPSLICNYLGQGALLLKSPANIENPFYLMAPEWCIYGLVMLSTIATIIASQSVLTGIFSISYQAIMLNYFPRLKIVHTSKHFKGQIYIPAINFVIYILTIGMVLKFRSSEHLAAAYGLCIASIMLITSILLFILYYEQNNWKKIRLFSLFAPLVLLDIIFVLSNLVKFFEGAWCVLAISMATYYFIWIWRKGLKARQKQKCTPNLSLENFIKENVALHKNRIPGSAIFLCRVPFKVPNALEINVKHNKYLHEKVFCISFVNSDMPYSRESDFFSIVNIGNNFYQVIVRSGFMQKPNIHKLLNLLEEKSLLGKDHDISIFLSKAIPHKRNSKSVTKISEHIYYFLSFISQNATDFFNLPNHKVIELVVRYKI
ncbi:MAG: KUP/HAK/KT family potassium transporter [Rickettsiaceae bacterium]|nr:KUP/HAK/KT family potassium transporter [Rickettsiaceae bacterium]